MLLLSLLDSHPGVVIPEREVFQRPDFDSPIAELRGQPNQLRRAAARSAAQGAEVWGTSIHPPHFLLRGITDPAAWCRERQAEGSRLITLLRDPVATALSSQLASTTGHWHQTNGDEDSPPPVTIDPGLLVEQVTLMETANADVERMVGDLSHLALTYEDALADRANHQATADLVFEYVGLPPRPANSSYRRAERPLAERVANLEELTDVLRACGRVLPE